MFDKMEKYLKQTVDNTRDFVTEHPYIAGATAIILYGMRCERRGMARQARIDDQLIPAKAKEIYNEGYQAGIANSVTVELVAADGTKKQI